MKLLHVITSLRTGGAETLVASMLPRLRACGVEADVALLDATPTPLTHRLAEAGIDVKALGKSPRAIYSPRRIADLKRIIGDYDVVHTHNTPAQVWTALAARTARRRPRLVTTEHNTSNRRRGLPFARQADRRLFGCYDRIACCSEAVAASLKAHLDSPKLDRRIVTIENGIDLTPFAALPEGKPGTRLLMVAAFRKQKRHDLVTEALRKLPEEFTLTLAGDGATRHDTERLAADLTAAGRLTFAGNVDDVARLMGHHDILLYATRHEGMSLAMVEGMASGRPLVATRAPGVEELTADSALLVDPSAEAIAKAVELLATDSRLYATLAERGRRRAARHDIAATTQKYLEIYRQLLSQSS